MELFTGKFQGPFFKALRSETDEQLTEAAKALEQGMEVLDSFVKASGKSKSPGYFLGSRSVAEQSAWLLAQATVLGMLWPALAGRATDIRRMP